MNQVEAIQFRLMENIFAVMKQKENTKSSTINWGIRYFPHLFSFPKCNLFFYFFLYIPVIFTFGGAAL